MSQFGAYKTWIHPPETTSEGTLKTESKAKFIVVPKKFLKSMHMRGLQNVDGK